MTITTNGTDGDREALTGLRQELAARIARLTEHAGSHIPFGPIYLYRDTRPTGAAHGMYEPSFCVVAQGRKQLLLGGDRFVYDSSDYLLVSAALPVAWQVLEASEACPYLCIGLALDPSLVGSVLVEAGLSGNNGPSTARALDVNRLDFDLLDAVLRLVRLLDTPQHAPMLVPLILREIVYRLLAGGQAARLRQIAVSGGQMHAVARAIDWLRRNYDKPMRIETLAEESRMSASGLHHHFKAVTAMSPLQFQKQMRLQEARRLMAAEGLNAAGAAYRVGYDDPSQFSREYRRMFGAPPARDVLQTRNSLAEPPLSPPNTF